jgi:hypothetical protein
MYKRKSEAAKRKKKAELDAKMQKKKITNFLNSPNDDISENSFFVYWFVKWNFIF